MFFTNPGVKIIHSLYPSSESHFVICLGQEEKKKHVQAFLKITLFTSVSLFVVFIDSITPKCVLTWKL